ncbi:S-adenosylmethionine decarboxylase/ornithine decarboxylase [Plasmodium reichenowi]|uniref:S-adenosylmethionine decarboxylase/ornithine decarboxylase n=1 Tax=Plasmodium reichenowi TaxID=5854 RepID=A0A151LFN8_PLARE|nr:S-adenosylmethionine decarboxylase/ornithine decarboxylase [Plasmodium reichenowi]KYN97788.1 S-adenosylmethionine decarboxylase/ornithine decarboxylase [Plasmodium reichenowi]
MNGIFEGIEKRVVIKLKESFFKGNRNVNSFLDIPKELWEEKLKYIGCSIVSEISEDKNERRGERCRVYLLSESSLYIFDDSLFIKTCGKTRVLFFIPFVVDLLIYHMDNVGIIEKNCVYDETFIENDKFHNIAEFIKEHFLYCFFTHMNYRNKTKDGYFEQEYPHKSVEDEKKFFEFFFKNVQMYNTNLPMEKMHHILFYCSDDIHMTDVASTFKFCSEIHLFGINKYNEKNQFHDAYLNKKSLNLFTRVHQDNLKLYDSDSDKELTHIYSTRGTYEGTQMVNCVDVIYKNEEGTLLNRNNIESIPSIENKESNNTSSCHNNNSSSCHNIVSVVPSERNNDNVHHRYYEDNINCSSISGEDKNRNALPEKEKDEHVRRDDEENKVLIKMLDTNLYECINDKKESFLYNEFYFTPCGYSCNVSEKNNYFCVHYSPEDCVSYVSVEVSSNLSCDRFLDFMQNQWNFYNGKYMYMINYVFCEDSNNMSKMVTTDDNNNNYYYNYSSGKSCFYYQALNEKEKEEYYRLKKKLTNDLFINSKQFYELHTFTERTVGFMKVQYFVYKLRDVVKCIEKETLLASSSSCLFMFNRMKQNDVHDDYVTKLSNGGVIKQLTERDVDDMYEYALNFCKQNKIAVVDTNTFFDASKEKENSIKLEKIQTNDKEEEKKEEVYRKDNNELSSLDHLASKNNLIHMYYDKNKCVIINKDDENSTIATNNNDNNNENNNENNNDSSSYVKSITISRNSSCNNSNVSSSTFDNNHGNEKMKDYICVDENNNNNNKVFLTLQRNNDDKNDKDEEEEKDVNIKNNMEKNYKEEIFNYYTKNKMEVKTLEKVLNENIDTSVVCINLQKILAQYVRFKKNLPHVTPFYSVKSNNDEVVIKFLYGLNCNFDCASIGEINKVIKLLPNLSRDRIIFANTIKSINSLMYARKENINLCTFDNLDELKKIYKYHPKCSLILRINVDFKNYKSYMSSKYGANEYEWEEMLLYAKKHNLNVVGVSFHVGSNTKNLFDFCLAIKLCRDVFNMSTNMGFNFYIINLGGGYPEELEYDNAKKHDKIHYCTLSLEQIKKDIENFLNEETFLKTKYGYYSFEKISLAINMSIDHYFSHMKDKLRVICEPGRYMVAASSTLAVKIIGKRRPTFQGIMLKDLKDHYDPLNFAQQEIKKQDETKVNHNNENNNNNNDNIQQGGRGNIMNDLLITSTNDSTNKRNNHPSSEVIENVSGTIRDKEGDNIKGKENTVDGDDNINIAHKNIGNNFSSSNSKLGNITNIKKKVVNINDNRYNYFSYYVSDSIYGCFSGIIFDEYNRCPIYVIKNKNNPNQNFMNSNLYLANVFGQSCDGLDMINSITYLPECYINDWLLYEYAGAYTFVSSSNFNGFKKCKKVYIFPESKPSLKGQPNKHW